MAGSSKNSKQAAALHPLMAQMFSSGLRKGERKKAELLARAIQILADGGLEALTYERLGTELKMSKSHVAYHFSNLSGLLMKATEFITATAQSCVVAELSQSSAGISRILAYVKGNFRWLRENPQQAKVFLIFYYLASQKQEFADFNLKVRTASRERIATILEECEVPPAKARQSAQFVLDAVTGAALECIILPTQNWKAFVDQKEKDCLHEVKLLLDG